MVAGRSKTGLDALLRPGSVAILGASDDPSRIGGRPLRYLLEAGFEGPVWPINPNRKTVQGRPAFPDLGSLPETPEFAIIALPAALVPAAVEACATRGVRAAVIFSAGFAETGPEGAALQAAAAAVAQAGDMRLLGPNCLGLFTTAHRYFPTFTSTFDIAMPLPGPVGIASQSGAYGSHLALLARQRGIGVSSWVSTGNEADVTVSEVLQWLVEDETTRVILAYAEGVRDPERLIAALAAAREARKPVIFMKVGRSSVGAEAARSHTAALAGSDRVYDGLFRQYGVHRAQDTDEMLDVAYAAQDGRFPAGRRLGLVTISGGVGIQMADAAEDLGLEVPAMPTEAQARMRAILPYASPRNPVDVTAQAINDMGLVRANIDVMLEEGGFDALAAFFTTVAGSPRLAPKALPELAELRREHPKRLMLLSLVGPPEIVRAFEEAGYPVFEDPTRMVRAAAALMGFGQSFAQGSAEAPALPPMPLVPLGPLDEFAAKNLLGGAGVPVLDERLAGTPEAVAEAAMALGFPVAIKIASPDIPHKTEVDGVRLGLESAAAAGAAAGEMLTRVRASRPEARIEGVLVSPMAGGGTEAILGVQMDPVFGPVVMFGLGGIFVEMLADVTFRVGRIDEPEAMRMIREIKGFPVLDGARGRPRADLGALAKALVRLSEFATANAGRIGGIEINPFLVLPEGQGGVALDALILPLSKVAE